MASHAPVEQAEPGTPAVPRVLFWTLPLTVPVAPEALKMLIGEKMLPVALLPFTSYVRVEAFAAARLTAPPPSLVKVLLSAVMLSAAVFAPSENQPVLKLLVKVDDCTFAVMLAVPWPLASAPCAPVDAPLLLKADPVTVRLSVPVLFCTVNWR